MLYFTECLEVVSPDSAFFFAKRSFAPPRRISSGLVRRRKRVCSENGMAKGTGRSEIGARDDRLVAVLDRMEPVLRLLEGTVSLLQACRKPVMLLNRWRWRLLRIWLPRLPSGLRLAGARPATCYVYAQRQMTFWCWGNVCPR